MLSGISHDLRTPLTRLKLQLAMIKQEDLSKKMSKDIDEMEMLGLLECDEEDFALCSFACPSKTDVSVVIRDGLDILQAEG